MRLFYKIGFKILKLLEQKRLSTLYNDLNYCGVNVRLHPTCHILVPQHMEIGDNTSISSYTTVYAAFGVKIGKNCLISSNCGISSYNHITQSFNRHDDVEEDSKYSKSVVIGNNVWIGMNSCILPGVTIGDNSIIGSGSIVTKNVPSNEIWAGNPARFLKNVWQ